MTTLPKPLAILLLVGFLAAISIPFADQKSIVSRHIGTVVLPVEQQGKYRTPSLQIRVTLANGELVLASAPLAVYRSAMPGDSVVVLEYRGAILGRREFLVQSLGEAP